MAGDTLEQSHVSILFCLPPSLAHFFSLSLFLVVSGIAYCWGDNSTGQVALPITTLTEVAKPRPVHTPSGSQPMQIACGANFTVIITGTVIKQQPYKIRV